MSSRRTRITAAASAAAVLAGGGIAAALAVAPAAGASVRPAPHACAWNISRNTLDLNLNGTDYTYPVALHVANDGKVTGVLFDKYLAALGTAGGDRSGLLAVNGICVGSNLVLDTNYPKVDGQGSRAEDMVITPTTPHRGTVAGVFTETGSLAESGGATFLYPVSR